MSAAPAIILVQPQLGENIGKTARAMLNFGMTDLRLVDPRDGWPNPSAGPAAAGADIVLDQASVFQTVAESVNDCHQVYATTVRTRDMVKDVVTPRIAAEETKAALENGQKVAFMFGREASGLSNEDVAHAGKIVTAPVNPEFGSLNLAQAVILIAYELFQTDAPSNADLGQAAEKATGEELEGLHNHLVTELEPRGYFRSVGREASQQLTLRNLMQNANFSSQQVQTLRGVIKSLTRTKC